MRSRPSPRLLLTTALLTSAACNEHPLKDVELSRTAETQLDLAIAPLRSVDILFVIDNSGSMAAEQANLAANLAPMIALLERHISWSAQRMNAHPSCRSWRRGTIIDSIATQFR